MKIMNTVANAFTKATMRRRQVVAALIRRPGELLLVQQQGPDDEAPNWTLPGGRLRQVPWPAMRDPTIAYLEGRAPAGTAWHYRQNEAGEQQLISSLQAEEGIRQ